LNWMKAYPLERAVFLARANLTPMTSPYCEKYYLSCSSKKPCGRWAT
jgi:hypothetical protein